MPLITVPSGVSINYIIPSSPFSSHSIDPANPTVVLLHPRFFDSYFFGPQYRDSRLAKAYNLVAIDHHYHGETQAPLDDEPYDYQKVAADVLSAMDALQIQEAHLLGNCLGAQIAVYMALISPDRVRSLTIIAQDPPAQDDEAIEQFRFLRDSCYEMADDGSDCLASDVVHGLHWIYFGDDPSAQPVLDEWVASSKFRPSNPKLIKKVFSSVLEREPMDIAVWDEITCPVLFVHGSADIPSPSKAVVDFYNTIRNADRELHIVEAAPHYLCFTHHREVNLYIADFLDKVTGIDSKGAAVAPRKMSRIGELVAVDGTTKQRMQRY